MLSSAAMFGRSAWLLASAVTLALVGCRSNQGTAEHRSVAPPETTAALSAAPHPAARNSAGARKDDARSPLGTNLTALRDWSPEYAFIDAFRASRPWISGTDEKWDDGRKLNVDEHGWVKKLEPGQLARTLVLWGAHPYPPGDLIVLYDGAGEIEYFEHREIVSSSPGRDVVRTKDGKLGIFIKRTDPKDYIRNIRVLMPGGVCEKDAFVTCFSDEQCAAGGCTPFEKTYTKQIFHPHFLSRLRGYSTFRFTMWGEAQGPGSAGQREWSDRPKVGDARWSAKGVPIEMMVELANRMNADAWFSMPHLASAAYSRQFAGYVAKHLKRGLTAYVEHSNEVWNSAFPQAAHAKKEGIRKNLAPGDDFLAQLRHHSLRSVEHFRIWKEALGKSHRLVRVMGSQAANGWVSTSVLEYRDAHEHTDALAIAPYFGTYLGTIEHQGRTRTMNLDELMKELEGPALTEVDRWMRDQAEIARRFGVDLIAYEAGQHLAGVGERQNEEKLNRLFDAANRDPRIKPVYLSYLAMWKKHGGHELMHYLNCDGPSKYGRWGALEHLLQSRSEAPKFDALMAFVERTPRWWKTAPR